MAGAGSGGGRTLSRDFKDVRRHTAIAAGQRFNGWVGLGVGLALGLSVALGVHLHYRGQAGAGPEPVPAPAQSPASSVAADDSVVGNPADPVAVPDLEFYDVLPRQGVEIPDASKADKGKRVEMPLPTGDAVLQAGSFKQSTEAERMVAKLALYGIAAKIQRASVEDETWYRVRIGPIATVEELREIQTKLREAEITATAVTPLEDAPPLP
jgi:cell division septation protein DedD